MSKLISGIQASISSLFVAIFICNHHIKVVLQNTRVVTVTTITGFTILNVVLKQTARI